MTRPGQHVLARRSFLGLLAALPAACAVPSCAQDPAVRAILAPTGKLRAGLYRGTPTSVIEGPGGSDRRGVGFDLGRHFAGSIDLPYEAVVFANNQGVLDAIKTGAVDIAFTNASPERAREMLFTAPYLEIELGYLARSGSPIRDAAAVDRPGVRVGVTEKSTSDGVLSRDLRQAQVVRAKTLQDGISMLKSGAIEVYATNKASLYEMADGLPGANVLPGNWGVERHAMALPKGHEQALLLANAFVVKAIETGLVRQAIERAGLRGAIVAAPSG